MLHALRRFIESKKLLEPGETIIVGYSGGADSTCLVHLLKRAGFEVIAAHLHHGQRPEADEEQQRCEEFANSLGVSFMCGNADVPTLAKNLRMSLETAGRRARYEFFRRIAMQLPGTKIATAHTLDDNAETILLNLLRGTGAKGLSGIPVERNGIIRPLLWARREETRGYCEQNGLWFHDDPANNDPRNTRSYMRSDVFPKLKRINAKALEHMARLGEILGEENALLDGIAAAMLERCEERKSHPLAFLLKHSEITLDAAKLRHHPPPLIRRGIRLLFAALGAESEYQHAQQVADAVVRSEKVSVTAEGGFAVIEAGGTHVRARNLTPVQPFRQPLAMPGETLCEELGWTISIYETQEPYGTERASLKAVLDAQKAKGPLFARPSKTSDTICPIGEGRARSLRGMLASAGVTSPMRARLPIVCDMLGPIWIPALALAERAKVDDSTARRLALQLSPISTDGTV